MNYHLLLNYHLKEFEFELSNGYIIFQIDSFFDLGIYKYSLPLSNFCGLTNQIKDPLKKNEILFHILNENIQYLNISILNNSLQIIGKTKIFLDEILFNYKTSNSLLPLSQTIWSYEFESIVNNAIGVGTRNGYIRGVIYLYKIPYLTQTTVVIQPKEEEEEEEFINQSGTGSLESTEVYVPNINVESSSLEEEEQEEKEDPVIPKNSSEPDRRNKPLRHFIIIDENQQIQTEYIPGYQEQTQIELPPQRSRNRPRWSISQSNNRTSQSHLLRCVACMLRSTQCQQCNEQQTLLEKQMISDLYPESNSLHLDSNILKPLPSPPNPISPPSPPPRRSRHGSPPSFQQPTHSNRMNQKKPITQPKQPTKQQQQQQQKKMRSKFRNHPMPNLNISPSPSRLRQHTYTSAVSIRPTLKNPMNSPSRGFHFVNPQPDYSQNRKVKSKQTKVVPNLNEKPNSEINSLMVEDDSNSDLILEDNYLKITQPINIPEEKETNNYEYNMNRVYEYNDRSGYSNQTDYNPYTTNMNMNEIMNRRNEKLDSEININWEMDEILLYIPGK